MLIQNCPQYTRNFDCYFGFYRIKRKKMHLFITVFLSIYISSFSAIIIAYYSPRIEIWIRKMLGRLIAGTKRRCLSSTSSQPAPLR